MLELHKSTVVDENRNPIVVQIPIDEFERIEEVYMKMNVQHRTPNVQRRIMMSLRSPKYLRENE